MFRKTTLALAAVVTLGTAALIPATADAHWSGYGWYGKSYGSPTTGAAMARATITATAASTDRATSTGASSDGGSRTATTNA